MYIYNSHYNIENITNEHYASIERQPQTIRPYVRNNSHLAERLPGSTEQIFLLPFIIVMYVVYFMNMIKHKLTNTHTHAN